MNLDTSFISEAAPAPETAAPESAPVAETQVLDAPTEPVDAPAVETPVAAPEAPAEPAVEAPPVADEEINEEDIQKLLENPASPKWFREQLKKFTGYSHKLKTENQTYQQQLEELRTQYEGKAPLPQEELERVRQVEEQLYKLSSYTAPVEEVLTSLKSVVSPNKLNEMQSYLTWEFLEAADGKPNLENLQVIIDRFAGEGGEKVAAQDVLNAIQAIKRGTVKPEEFHEFASDAEYEAYTKARSMEQEIEAQRQLALDNARYQETETRKAMLQNVMTGIQSQFQPQMEGLLKKFQLDYVPGEPKVAAEFKQEIRNKLAVEINRASMENPALTDVFKALDLLSKPVGARAEQIQQEIQAYTNSFPYQTAVSRGLSELMGTVEKVVNQEAYRYKLMMMGYEAEVSKGQNAREVVGAPNQTEVLTQYTPEQLAKMSASERRHAILMDASNKLREMNGKGGGQIG